MRMRSPTDKGPRPSARTARPPARPGEAGAGVVAADPPSPGLQVSPLLPGWSLYEPGVTCATCGKGGGYCVSIKSQPPVHLKCLDPRTPRRRATGDPGPRLFEP